ncbi:hypothetical protein AB0M20_38060, partial [Actinoplanes sp. NPDC051633]
LEPLPLAVARRFPDLARQPLLLLMLALYDATDNALQAADSSFGTVQLYERLLGDFARREVRRWHGKAPDGELDELVEDELMRLSIVAFAMFNRGRLWVTEEELNADLVALGIAPARTHQTGAFRSALTPGQEVVGRFFFIQRAQANQDGRTLQTYEFLHATFGEYLVARFVVNRLRENASQGSSGFARLRAAPVDDELLRSLLWYMSLNVRQNVVTYAAELIAPDRAAIRAWLVDRIRAVTLRSGYAPRPDGGDIWVALYSLNLTLLALACGEELSASELWPDAKDPAELMRMVGQSWHCSIPSEFWLDVMAGIEVERTWTDGRRDIVLSARPIDHPEQARGPLDPLWSHRIRPGHRIEATPGATFGSYFNLARAQRSMNLIGALSDDTLRHAADPFIERMPYALTSWVSHGEGDSESVVHSLLRVLLASAAGEDDLPRLYERAVTVACGRMENDADRRYLREKTTLMLVRTMERDRKALGSRKIFDLLSRIVSAGPADDALASAITHCMTAGGSETEARWLRSRMEIV